MAESGEGSRHRGAHSQDVRLFAADKLPILRAATGDLSWLLSRGYALASALTLVGDRHTLHERQRVAVARAACADGELARRRRTCIAFEKCENEPLLVDGFNVLITVEAALGGGVLLGCRDGCVRDLSSVHGSYRAVAETERALLLVGEALKGLRPASVTWLLDRPVSNSGRLAARVREVAQERGWAWEVEVVFSPDGSLAASEGIAVTSDAAVLSRVRRWANVTAPLVRQMPDAWRVDLGATEL